MYAYAPISSAITLISAPQVRMFSRSQDRRSRGTVVPRGSTNVVNVMRMMTRPPISRFSQRGLNAERPDHPAGADPHDDHERLGQDRQGQVEHGIAEDGHPAEQASPHDHGHGHDVGHREQGQRGPQSQHIAVHRGRVPGDGHRHRPHRADIQRRRGRVLPAQEQQARRGRDGPEGPRPRAVRRGAHIARDADVGPPVALVLGAIDEQRQHAHGDQDRQHGHGQQQIRGIHLNIFRGSLD